MILWVKHAILEKILKKRSYNANTKAADADAATTDNNNHTISSDW